MSVYAGDNAEQIELALASLVEQSKKPDEIILVIDGPVSEEIEATIQAYQANRLLSIIHLEKNKGAAAARYAGVAAAKCPLIALMDADDISNKSRFELQLEKFANSNVDVLGGFIEEFSVRVGDMNSKRKVPLTQDEILSFSKWRNPINNVTLMFKKEVFESVGGYSDVRLSEDWDFIIKVLVSNYKVQNIPETLVYVRAGDDMLGRRRRLVQVIAEVKLFWRMYNLGHMTLLHASSNTLLRVALRILPKFFTKFLYSKILRSPLT